VPDTDNAPEGETANAVTPPSDSSLAAYSTGNDGWRTSHDGDSRGSAAISSSSPEADRESVVIPVPFPASPV
jgi:hypothetical protein